MGSFDLPRLAELDEIVIARFREQGFRLDESFFPVLWSRSGARTAWIEAYCDTGQRTTSQAHA